MRFLGFDVETTRLPSGSRAPEIVQLAMISGHSGNSELEIDSELVLTLDPELDAELWQEQSILVHGIRPEDVEGKPTFLEVFNQIWDVAAGCKVLVGYNLGFDVECMQAALQRYGVSTHFPWPRYHVDVMDMAMDRLMLEGKRGQKAPTLGEIYESVTGGRLVDAHDAMADIRATAVVWHHMNR